ncbi:MAG: hypothetical protein NT028_11270, partial [candidate division Zixibacteria bacterium]|nr:hypothetical protein [candidate division Zixibacteria bacterium]
MKTAFLTKIALVLAGLYLVCPGMSRADLPVLFYDNFDDGNFDGWSPTYPTTGDPATPPDVVPSPQGYSLRGVGSGYYPTDDPGLTVLLSHPVSLNNVGKLSIEFRAKSGPQWPNQAQVWLVSGNNVYIVHDYGESNRRADWLISVNGQTQHEFNYSIGNLAYEWHDFAWTRDGNGWWSLSIDGQIQAANFYQDNQLTSFDKVGMHIVRNQSEIEWVRISGVATPPENWQIVYQTDFSSDPGWITNWPDRYVWDPATGTYCFSHIMYTYSYIPIAYDPTLKYKLEFDINLTQCEWGSYFNLGLWDADMLTKGPTHWHVRYHHVDEGNSACIVYWTNDLYGGGDSPIMPFALNAWYHNKAIYDPTSDMFTLEI